MICSGFVHTDTELFCSTVDYILDLSLLPAHPPIGAKTLCLVLYFSFYLTRIRNGRTAIRAALDFDTWRVLYITSGLKASDAAAVPEDVSFFLLFFFGWGKRTETVLSDRTRSTG